MSALVANGALAEGGSGEHRFEVEAARDGKRNVVFTGSNDKLGGNAVNLIFEDLPAGAELVVSWNVQKYGLPWVEKNGNQFTLHRPVRNGAGRIEGTVSLRLKGKSFEFAGTDGTPLEAVRLFDPVRSNFLDYDLDAFDWWVEQIGRSDEGAFGYLKDSLKKSQESSCRKPQYLVHLPSGVVVAPYPSDITEGTPTQVVAIVPTDGRVASVSLEVKQCGIPQTFRTTIETKPKPKEPSEVSVKDDTETKPDEEVRIRERFALVTVGPLLRCGTPELEYEIKTHLRLSEEEKKIAVEPLPTPQKLRVNPKYHMAAIFAVGYDIAKNTEYYKAVQDGDVADVQIAEREVMQGAIAYVGALWMIGGVDYHNMRWWNYIFNLFVAVNLVSPLDDITTGLAFTPTGGISLAIGVSLHRRTRLDNGWEVGNTFDDAGDIPTSRRWEKPLPGAFFGLTIDSNIFKALKANFKE